MIEIKGISKIYSGGTDALTNINIDIKRGEFVFLTGASGSGKTTLIKLMFKEIKPTKGQIFINDYDVKGLKSYQIPYLRRSMGVVFQDFRLIENKTAYENIEFAMRVLEAHPDEIAKRIPSIIHLCGLNGKEEYYPSQLSGGEQQRVALARAVVNRPPLLIADEPTGNLDPTTSIEIMKLIEEINRMGTTILVATHDKDIVNAMEKRVIHLKHGKIISDEMKGQYIL